MTSSSFCDSYQRLGFSYYLFAFFACFDFQRLIERNEHFDFRFGGRLFNKDFVDWKTIPVAAVRAFHS